jgi:hypothetical protein
MRHPIAALILLGLLVAVPSSSGAQQTVPGVNTPFGGLARQIAGIEFIKAEISDLRRQLSGCNASRTGACASRALLQAKLNYLLEVGMALGDPDTAGAPPKPLTKPTEATDYEGELSYLQQQLGQEPPAVYIISENRAKYFIILHCKAMKDTRALRAYMTPEEIKASMDDDRTGKTKANVSACITEYDARAIAANRKTALEYCVPATTEKDNGRPLMNLCMHKHDMLTAMCKQELDFMALMRQHKEPQSQHAPQVCPQVRVFIGPGEVQAIMAAPAVRTMAGLPPKFVAPPDVVTAPRPPLPIPAGTVIELKIQGSWDGAAIDNVDNYGLPISAGLDKPVVVGGKTVVAAPAPVMLKGRIIGDSARFETRPETVQIAFTTDEINIDAPDCRPCGKWADLKSNEVVFTVPYRRTATNQGVIFDTRLRFTIGGSGSVDMSSAQTPPARTPGARPAPTAPPPATTPPATPSPQSQAEEAARRAERIQACVFQAMKALPSGSPAQAQAIAACAQIK